MDTLFFAEYPIKYLLGGAPTDKKEAPIGASS
jgi:hypothetical protein